MDSRRSIRAYDDAGYDDREFDGREYGYEDYGARDRSYGLELRERGREPGRRNGGQGGWPWFAAGAVLAGAGGYLLYRGARAAAQGVDWPHGKAVRLHHSLWVEKPARELYGFWHSLENLPRVMSHLESVEDLGGGRSRWVAKGPAGTKVSWEAQIVEDRPNRLLSWRSLPDSQVPNEGTVRFDERAGGEATELRVSLTYFPPAGRLGAAVARMFGKDPSREIGKDLRRFKQLAESGQTMMEAYGGPAGRQAREAWR